MLLRRQTEWIWSRKLRVLLLLILCSILISLNNLFFEMTSKKTQKGNTKLRRRQTEYDPEAEQLARLERMDQVCSRPYTLGDDSYPSLWTRDEQQSYQVLATDHIFTHHILVDHDHKALYCYVPKVSCTNLKRLMIMLGGTLNETDLLSISRGTVNKRVGLVSLDDLEYSRIVEVLTSYTKFMFVRHPLERVVSAYVDKFTSNTYSAVRMSKQEGMRFQMMYRKNSSKISEEGNGTTFEEFVTYIVDTFQSKSEVMNDHWERMSHLCQPCLTRYHFIGKLEHIGADSALLLSSLKAPEHLSYPPVEKSKTSHVYDSYMDQLSTALRQELKNVYREDFEIFGYEERNAV